MGGLRMLRRRRRGGGAHSPYRPTGTPGQAVDIVLLGAIVHTVASVAHDRAPADAPWPPAASDVRAVGWAPRRSHIGHVALGRRLRHPGGGQVAYRGEHRIATS